MMFAWLGVRLLTELTEFAYLAENLAEVRAEIAHAKAVGAHAADNVKLLAVSKTVPADVVAACWRLGVDGLAENRVQELLTKQEELPADAKWHMIGHLQTNKVRQIIGRVQMIHSLESWRLAEEIEKRAAAQNIIVPCLLEVNVAAEDSKFGLAPAEVWDFVQAAAGLPHIKLAGLMTVAPNAPAEEVRPVFAELRELRAEINRRAEKIADLAVNLQELSMGMSNDYKIAVEEGATMVRVGSRIFGGRVYR